MNVIESLFQGDNQAILTTLLKESSVTKEQLGSITGAIMPKVTEVMQNSFTDEKSSADIMGLLGDLDLGAIQSNPSLLFEGKTLDVGKKLLSTLVGGDSSLKELVSELSDQSDVSANTLNSFLPALVTAVLSIVMKSGASGLSALISSALSSNSSGNSSSGISGLAKSFLDQDGDGSISDDLLAHAKKLF